jgi:integrase
MGYAERSGKFENGKPKYRARWQLPERTEKGRRKEGHEDGFTDPDSARQYANDQEALIRAGLYFDPSAGKISLAEYFDLWLPIQKVKPGTKLTYRQYFNREIKPAWGGTPLVEIKTMRLMQWLGALNDPQSPRRLSKSAINLVETILNGMFALAVYEDRIRKSPIPPPSAGGRGGDGYKPVREGQIFTRDEFAALLANLATWHDVVFCITMLFLGTRVSETAAVCRSKLKLQVPRFPGELFEGTYLLDPLTGQLAKDEYYVLDFASPKSGPGRLLDLPPFHVALLADWIGRIPKDRDRLFAAPMGGMLRVNEWNAHVFRPACDGREAYASPHGRNFHPAIAPACPGRVTHDFKHTAKSIMADARVNEIMQNYSLGHREQGSSAPYKHPTPKMRQERLDALQGIWEEWAIELTELPAWHAKDGPGTRRSELPAPRFADPATVLQSVSTPVLLQVDQPTLF